MPNGNSNSLSEEMMTLIVALLTYRFHRQGEMLWPCLLLFAMMMDVLIVEIII